MTRGLIGAAIKVLSPNFTKDQAQVRRFQQEARAASALNHPNIITVYDINEAEGTQFIASESSKAKHCTRDSPLFKADQIKAPLLILQGDNDPRVP